jgi:hypothetical protein
MYTIQTNTAWQVISANASLAFQVTGYHPVLIGISGNTAPAAGFRYDPGQGDRGDTVTLFPSVSGDQVWARSSIPSEVTVG